MAAMNYICPFCRSTLTYEEGYYYCYDKVCVTNYSICDGFNEEYETDAYGFHLHVDIFVKNNTYSISIVNEDITDFIEKTIDIQEIKLQDKTEPQISKIINKIKKFYDMKAFW